jgi:hypothetical protein
VVVVGVAAWVEGYHLGRFGFGWVAIALPVTIVLSISVMRTYWSE